VIGALLVRAGKIPAAELESDRTKWYQDRKDSGVWGALAAAYAAPVETAEEAAAALPRLESPPPNAFVGGIEQIGKVYALAGRHAEAIPHLRRDARRCEASRYPIEQTRMLAWLGKALEAQNDGAGACSAYAEVLRRWGSASPSSVTATEVRSRSQALRCPAR
jgi:predicted Zn-dependent protease